MKLRTNSGKVVSPSRWTTTTVMYCSGRSQFSQEVDGRTSLCPDPISPLRIEELPRTQTAIHNHHRHPQYATGITGLRYDGSFSTSSGKGGRMGYLVEYDKTEVIFQTPQQATQEYERTLRLTGNQQGQRRKCTNADS